MKINNHPSGYIAPDFVKAIRDVAGEAEQLKHLHPAQLAIIHEQKWFRLFVPEHYDGMELNLPEALRLEEALAWTDGSVGWTVTLCAGAGWFIGFLDPELAAVVFNNNNVCLAGSGKPTGIAKVITEGYEVTGYWDYATGSGSATAFTANCLIEEDGILLNDADGNHLVQAFLLLPGEVTIHENWKRIGMIATGSNSFEANAVVVKKNRTFLIDNRSAVLKHPVYQYPFLQFAETTLAVNSAGMAIRFLDLCKFLFEQKSTGTMQAALVNGLNEMDAARQQFYRTVSHSWEACCNDCCIAPQLLNKVSIASKQLAFTSRKVVDELYPSCGMQAANPDTEINRVWRNLHTASQHSIFNR